ncbi:MAG TPA: HD domain-containing protein [Firmicutes bacterium]|nr:HD domain-containing protein [Bacillota bacterium]
MVETRLAKQLDFIAEVDKLKKVFRQNVVIGTTRNENAAEHSWHLALMALLFSEYARDREVDLLRVVKMVLIHDLVEIDAGDTFCYDEAAHADKEERELAAAERIFNLLPEDQARELWDLWREFEEQKTPEARFANSLDRFQPLLLNHHTQAHTWTKPGVTREKVLQRYGILAENTPTLWEYAQKVINEACEEGYLQE